MMIGTYMELGQALALPRRKSEPIEFKATPLQMRAMYEHGWGIIQIMERTGKDYGEVYARLLDAGTRLVTSGPHDFSTCRGRHNHRLAYAHAKGAACCECTVRPRSRRERRI